MSDLLNGNFVDERTGARAWQLLALVLALILVVYRETFAGMAATWLRSNTFTHGFMVAPISLWLIWRMRARLAALAPRADWRILPLFVLAGFAWLLGELGSVVVVSQFAAVTLLVLAVPAMLGLSVARQMLFPLAFLYFAVPFGDFALPLLMEWTADFTVRGLRLSGVPVYREGLQFVIPTGTWSVVEACSGVRYIIASLTVGALFAYLTYRSAAKRVLFMVVALVVPLVANWIRAYMIVMLGHLSGNKLAAGVDHLIYGWLFFGVVIMIVFWIGSRWREDVPPDERVAEQAGVALSASLRRSAIAALAIAVLALAGPAVEWLIGRNAPADVERIALLENVPGWTETPESVANWTPRFENYSASRQTAFKAGEQTVGMFLAYYRNQDERRKLVSSTNVLVLSDDYRWLRVASGGRTMAGASGPLPVRTAVLRAQDGTRLVVWQWYWINGRVTTSDLKAKAYTALSRLAGQGDDSAVVIVYARQEPDGEAALAAFVNDAGQVIERALQRTWETREER
ncbi:exosortase A [Propionivibrio limicola]|uniref:exosortase A n=1 Tax=Propionivibrio limicola TaxID=167645 RepID=UPI001290B0B9|nr:exosortase A [Propionivibrio limicola]